MTKEEFQKKYLSDEEKILWYGTADTLHYFSARDILLIPLSLLLGGFLLFYCYLQFMLMLSGKSFAFALSGITLFLIGIYLIFGRIWYRHKRISRNIYVVTNLRCLVFNTLRDNVCVDMPLEYVSHEFYGTNLYLGKKSFGSDILYGLGLDLFLHKMVHETPGFYAISNAQEASKVIKRAKKNVKKERSDADEFI